MTVGIQLSHSIHIFPWQLVSNCQIPFYSYFPMTVGIQLSHSIAFIFSHDCWGVPYLVLQSTIYQTQTRLVSSGSLLIKPRKQENCGACGACQLINSHDSWLVTFIFSHDSWYPTVKFQFFPWQLGVTSHDSWVSHSIPFIFSHDCSLSGPPLCYISNPDWACFS